MMQISDTVKQLLIINIILFVGSMFVPNANELLSLHYFESDGFHFWQPLSSMFMHGSPSHLFFNMFALYSFGSALEQIFGAKKFLIFYLACGFGATLLHSGIDYYHFHSSLSQISNLHLSSAELHSILNSTFDDGYKFYLNMFHENSASIFNKNNISEIQIKELYFIAIDYKSTALGASGAIYGLLVAFAFLFPAAELGILFIPIPIKAKYFVPFILCVDLFMGLKGQSIFGSGGTGIAHFAHLGGAITGFILIYFWKKSQFDKFRWN